MDTSIISPQLQNTASQVIEADEQQHDGPPKKRARYTPVAWYASSPLDPTIVSLCFQIVDSGHSNDCKRRKVKCNGQIPCERCNKLSINCEYAPNYSIRDPYLRNMQEHIESLQQQVNDLYARMHAAGIHGGQQAYTVQSPAAPVRQPLDPNIQDHGVTFGHQVSDDGTTFQYGHAAGSSPYPTNSPPRTVETGLIPNAPYAPMFSPGAPQDPIPQRMHENKDPVWSMELADVAAVIQNLTNVDQSLAACLDLSQIMTTAQSLFSFVDSVRRTGLMNGEKAGPDAMNGINVDLMKMTIAISLHSSYPDRLPEAQLLAQNVKSKLGNYLFESGDARTVALFLLVAVMSLRDSGDVAAAQRALNVSISSCSEIGLESSDIATWPVSAGTKIQLSNLVQYVRRFQTEQLVGTDGKDLPETPKITITRQRSIQTPTR